MTEYVFTKIEINNFISEKKKYKDSILEFKNIKRKLKLKPNHPPYFGVKLEIDPNYTIYLQDNNDEEFPEYSAILVRSGVRICRLDLHDAHRRVCKKEIFSDRVASELHIHLYCTDCIEEKLKYDSFVLSIDADKLNDLSFQCFCALFCKIINLENNIYCKRTLFYENT